MDTSRVEYNEFEFPICSESRNRETTRHFITPNAEVQFTCYDCPETHTEAIPLQDIPDMGIYWMDYLHHMNSRWISGNTSAFEKETELRPYNKPNNPDYYIAEIHCGVDENVTDLGDYPLCPTMDSFTQLSVDERKNKDYYIRGEVYYTLISEWIIDTAESLEHVHSVTNIKNHKVDRSYFG